MGAEATGELETRPLEPEGGSDWDIGADGTVVPDDWGSEACPGCGTVYSSSGEEPVPCVRCIVLGLRGYR